MEPVKTEMFVQEPTKAEKEAAKGRRPGRTPKRSTVKTSAVFHNTADESDHEESPTVGGYLVLKYLSVFFIFQERVSNILYPYYGVVTCSLTFLSAIQPRRLVARCE